VSEVKVEKRSEHEVFINPVLRRPSALRSMLPALLSSRSGRSGAEIVVLYPYFTGEKARETS